MTDEEYFSDVQPVAYCHYCKEPIYIGDLVYHDLNEDYIFCSSECVLDYYNIVSEEMYTE